MKTLPFQREILVKRQRFMLLGDPCAVCSYQIAIWRLAVDVKRSAGSVRNGVEIVHLSVNSLPPGQHSAACAVGNWIQVVDISVHICKPACLHISIFIKVIRSARSRSDISNSLSHRGLHRF